jgi:hypothetical protein
MARTKKTARTTTTMDQQRITDYPFTCWAYYGEALVGSLNTGYDNRTHFPAYTEESGERGELSIVQEMLKEGFTAQEGLDTFIASVAEGTRYGSDLFQGGGCVGHAILKEFHAQGAVPELYPIFKVTQYPQASTSVQDLKCMFEDQASGHHVRGILLDAVSELWTPDVAHRADWASLDEMYWEDILDAEGLLTHDSYEKCLAMSLKSSSTFLSSYPPPPM